jgi:hypothetical protein
MKPPAHSLRHRGVPQPFGNDQLILGVASALVVYVDETESVADLADCANSCRNIMQDLNLSA